MFLWAGAIAYSIKQITIVKVSRADAEALIYKFHMFIWPTATILTLLPYTTSPPEDVGNWCWIPADGLGNMWRWISFYGPLWIVLIYITHTYYTVWKELSDQQMGPRLLRMQYYPMVLFGCWVIPSIHRLINLFGGEGGFAITLLHGIGDAINGACNAAVYGLTREVYETNAEFCCPEDPEKDPKSSEAEIQVENPDNVVNPGGVDIMKVEESAQREERVYE